MADADTTYYKNMIGGLIDDLLVAESKTTVWDASADVVATFNGGKYGRIPSLSLGKLTDYDALTGFDASLVGCTWEDTLLQYDRGKKLILDMVKSISDNAGLPTAGRVLGQFMRKAVVPEIDLCRMAAVSTAMSGATGHIATGYTPAKGTIIGKIAEGLNAIQDETGVDFANIVINGKYRNMVETSTEISRTLDVRSSDGGVNNKVLEYNGCPVTFCPSSRCWSAVTKDSSTGEIAKATGAKEVVAVLSVPDAIQGVVSREVTKIINADQSEIHDAASVSVRVYHGCFIPSAMKDGVYVITT